jgi:nitrite reductase/ring-hydroxylating ferredoxin subunit
MTKTWAKVIELAAVPADDVTAVISKGREIALYSVDGLVYATDNICTQRYATAFSMATRSNVRCIREGSMCATARPCARRSPWISGPTPCG